MSAGRQPVPVLAVLWADGLTAAEEEEHIAEGVARMDDAYWARYIRQPFSWHRFTIWWVARRWVRPRDIQKE